MTSQIIDGVIYDTEVATLVLEVPSLGYHPRMERFDRPANIFFPGEIECADCKVYVGANGEWFVVERLLKSKKGLFGRSEDGIVFKPITPEIALKLLHQINAIDQARKWFPDQVRNA